MSKLHKLLACNSIALCLPERVALLEILRDRHILVALAVEEPGRVCATRGKALASVGPLGDAVDRPHDDLQAQDYISTLLTLHILPLPAIALIIFRESTSWLQLHKQMLQQRVRMLACQAFAARHS